MAFPGYRALNTRVLNCFPKKKSRDGRWFVGSGSEVEIWWSRFVYCKPTPLSPRYTRSQYWWAHSAMLLTLDWKGIVSNNNLDTIWFLSATLEDYQDVYLLEGCGLWVWWNKTSELWGYEGGRWSIMIYPVIKWGGCVGQVGVVKLGEVVLSNTWIKRVGT